MGLLGRYTYSILEGKNRGSMTKTLKFGMRRQTISDKAFEGRWRGKGVSITAAQYNALIEDQEFCCAICKAHQDTFKYGLCIDHDHESGDVRGLLCINCNALLGHAKDSAGILESAISYLLREISLESIEGVTPNE